MQVPLIIGPEPVARLDRASQRPRHAHGLFVYMTPDRRLEVFDQGRTLSRMDQMSGRYQHRYEVDMSDHRRTLELRTAPPPALGGVYHFQTQVNVGFRVVDPEQVILRGIHDGLQVVADFLMQTLWRITSAFPIEEARAAENAVNDEFRHPETIEDCIELYRCVARLSPDPAAVEHLRRVQTAKWDNLAKVVEHDRDSDDARRDNNLDLIRQSGSLEKRAREREALAGRPFSMQDLLALHLENEPGDTKGALEMAAEIEARQAVYRDNADDKQWDRFRYMAEKNLVQTSELNQVRNEVVDGLSRPPSIAARPAATGDWDTPLPEVDRSGPAPAAAGRPELPGLIPIYVVIDESSAMAAGIDAVNAGMQSLYDEVAGDPEIAEVVRLAVLSYADGASVRVPARPARWGVRLPAFTVAPGPARLAAAFERLADCIPRDATELKRETPSLRRPQVLLLTGGQPADDPQWADAHRALVDRASQRYAPDVIACGVGGARPETVLGIATQPELAFVAPGTDTAEAVRQFCDFLRRRVLQYGRAVLDGDQVAVLTAPPGFRPAAGLPSSTDL